jgi:hypothetical protein
VERERQREKIEKRKVQDGLLAAGALEFTYVREWVGKRKARSPCCAAAAAAEQRRRTKEERLLREA